MKRNLFTIAAGLLIGFGAAAQGPNLTEREGWAVVDSTTSHDAIIGLTEANGFAAMNGAVDEGWTKQYSVSWGAGGTEMIVNFTKNDNIPDWDGNNWDNITLNMQEFDGGEGDVLKSKFAKFDTIGDGVSKTRADAMIQRGHVVDFSDPTNAYISFEYKLTSGLPEVTLQFDLRDILGRSSNANETAGVSRVVGDVLPTSEWKPMILAWDPNAVTFHLTTPLPAETDEETGDLMLFDRYSPKFMDFKNPWTNKVPGALLATDKITALMIAIFPDATASQGDKATLTIKNLKIGKADADTWERVMEPCVDCTGIKIVEGCELDVKNGVVYSAGTIVVTSVTGQVVATANGEFNTNSLKGGIYLIKTACGTAKIVK